MNYGELIENIKDLGFSDESEIEDFGSIIPNCINRAITEINLFVAPIIGTYQIEQDGDTEDLIYYDIEELTKDDDGNVKFLTFADTPVMYGDKVYTRYNDFDIESGKILVIDGSVSGKFRVFYKKAHVPYTESSDSNSEIELPLKAHQLLPLLASYYIWLDDDQTKSVYYYNRYETLAADLQATDTKPKARIISDWGM